MAASRPIANSTTDDDIWYRDLTVLEKLRLAWDEYIVLPGRVTQVFGLALSTVLVLVSNLPTDWHDYRLPDSVRPVRYALDLTTDMSGRSFHGTIAVALNLTSPTRVVVVHAAGGLVVDEDVRMRVPVVAKGGETSWAVVGPSTRRVDEEREFVVFTFERALRASDGWVMDLSFHGELTDSLRGYYISSYTATNKQNSYIATTQFQPTDARRARSFQINMTVPSTHTALSNMPVQLVEDVQPSSTPSGRLQVYHKYIFPDTKRMSTYLVAYIVSNFDHVSSQSRGGVSVSVYTQPGKTKLGQYALDVAVRILEFYERIFGIAYPLPKLDLVAIPDFAAGAMENWGLVTYRETALLYDDASSPPKDRQRVASVIAHELAHQWFGNLVTMDWWGDLWINEGFATFMEYKGTHSVEPTWRMDEQFFYHESLNALDADASSLSHPVSLNVTNSEEIEEIFDDISYAKGASLLRMLEAWLNAVRDDKYFFTRIFRYSNAETADLWQKLDHPSLKIAEVMSSWTGQPGYPVLIVEGGPETNKYTVRQQRFLKKPSFNSTISTRAQTHDHGAASGAKLDLQSDDSEGKDQWKLPVMIRGYSRAGTRIGGPLVLRDEVAPYLLLNAGRSGLYRVLYPNEVWGVIIEWVEKDVLGPADRLGVISDAFELSFAGLLDDVTIPLNLARTMADEEDFVVWKIALHELDFLDDTVVLDSSAPLFEAFQRRILQQLVDSLSWNETAKDHGHALLRGQILEKAVALGLPLSVQTAYHYFSTLKAETLANGFMAQRPTRVPVAAAAAAGTEDDDDEDPPFTERDLLRAQAHLGLPPDVLGPIWDAGVVHGDDRDFAFAVRAYETLTSATEKDRVMHALASARKAYQIREVLGMTLGGKVRKQDVTTFYKLVVNLNGQAHINVWSFFKDRWHDIVSLWTGSDWTGVNDVLKEVVSKFTEPSAIAEARRLFVAKAGRAGVAVAKGVEIAESRVQWLKKNRAALHDWLKHEVGGGRPLAGDGGRSPLSGPRERR
ncbi:peptidase family M1-domain-containing protein [Zopfochytrium polystomum]|nr:peptidase family M1-domain-containing protein [Zopfochytrium polystomum]